MKLNEAKRLFRAVSDGTRLRILNLLSQGELCVCDVMCVLRQPQSKVSRHFAYLRKAGLVTARKEGLWMHYSLSKADSKTHKAILNILASSSEELGELKKDSSELCRMRGSLVGCCK